MINNALGLIRTRRRNEMLFARQTIVNAAGAFGLQSLDLVRLSPMVSIHHVLTQYYRYV